jgi:hypothetical protein
VGLAALIDHGNNGPVLDHQCDLSRAISLVMLDDVSCAIAWVAPAKIMHPASGVSVATLSQNFHICLVTKFLSSLTSLRR